MSEKQWVQHISGQGEKWEAIASNEFEWVVRAKHQVTWGRHFLPKSEYRLCDPPKEWQAIGVAYMAVQVIDVHGQYLPGEYRIRMTGVEQKVKS